MNHPDRKVDQSQFAVEQESTQLPPEELARQQYVAMHKDELQKIRRKYLLLFLGIVFAFSMVIAFFTFRPPAPPPEAPPPTPTLPPPGPSALEQELKRLKNAVDEADPQVDPFAPPAVDMEVEF